MPDSSRQDLGKRGTGSLEQEFVPRRRKRRDRRHRLPIGGQAGALSRVSKDETASMTSAIGGTGPMIIVAIAL